MTRKIYLNGEMANKFGTVHPFVGDTVQDAVRLLSANNSEFKPYLINCMENDIQFSVAVHGQELTDIKECLLPLTEGDIIITPIPAGSKSGEAKILTAMAIAALMFIPVFGPTMAQMAVGPMQAQSLFALSQATGGLAAAAGMAGVAIAANLAINGIQQIMAPDPSVDDDEEQGYMLSGSQKNAVEGDPVPVLYGELRVPGTPVSFEVSNTQYKMQSEAVTASGGLQSMIAAAGFRDDPSQPGRMKLHPEDLATLTSAGPESETTTMYKTLNSFGKNQDICVTDVISEGPILGLVNNNNSVYLNDVPAVDLGNAAVTRASTGAKFYLQQNNTQVTYKPNGQAALPPSDGVNDRWLDIKDYKTQESASVAIKEVAVGYPVNSVIVTTDTAFFPTTNAEKASWVFNGNSELQNVVTHLSIGGNITDWHIPSLGTLVGTGDDAVGVSAFLSSTRCIFMNKSYKIPNSIKQNIKNGDDFKVHVDYAQSFKTMTGNTITLNTVFLGTTGDYAANITGTDRDIIEVHRGIGSSIKYDGFRCNFKTGHLDQEFFPAPAGTGMGNIALPGGVSNEAIAGPLDGATDSVKTFTGTNSGHFALSDSQAREADEIRILFTYGSLTNTSAKGTDHDGKAFYKMRIRLKHGSAYGNWQNIHTLEAPLRHIGFSRSAVSIEEILVLRDYGTNFSDFQVEITRLSEIDRAYYTTFSKPYNADYTSATPCTIVSLNTIIKENLSYPYTAMAQVGINTKAFRTVPKRTYHLKGLLVKVPSNYVTRDETSDSDGGANYRRVDKDTIHASEYQNWDGAFREESVYTNNPAWIFYDIITNNRYGLGAWLTATDIDKYALYRIGRYCDEMVPDGNGGLEPRFTTNVYFQKATDAYKVLKDLSTVFRGMLYWLDGNIFPIMDEPKNPVYNFTTGNVIDGLFSYQSTGSKTRTNQTVVTWINPEQDYKQEALLVEDKENIIETGKIISENAVAFGAVTEGQATRYGRWKVWTAKNQTEIVSFKTALGAAFLAPGDVVNIQDANRASSQLQYSGRVSSASTPSTTVIPLDRAVSLNSGSTYELSVLIEKPGVFLTQNDSATIEGVVYNKGDLILGTYTESQASDIIQTNGSSAPILSGGLEQPVTTAWQPYTRVETQAVHASSIAASPTSSITVQAAFSEEPNIQTIWALKEVNAAGVEVSGSKKPYKILSISEGKNEYDITAVEHYNDKFVEVDEDFTHSVGDTVYPSITASDTVPPPGVFYASTRNINDSGEIADDVILFWDAPTNPGKSVGDVGYLYEHVKGYQLEHDGATITLPRTSTSFTGLDIPAGTYTLGLRTLSTIDSISLPATVTITIEEADPEAIPRYAGMPIGGVLSRDIDLVATTSPTAKTFKILNAAYKFSSAASPLSLTERSGGAVTTYQQDCTNITTVNYAGLSSDFERQVAAHYIFFDSSDTSDTLKLIKYYRDSNLNENYFYDAGTGSGTAASNFNAAGTGTITLAANSIKVIGASTAFETDYNVGEIIYFNSTQAARIAHIASNTDIRLDKSFPTAIAAGSSHYPQKFKFDKKFDAAIATIRNNNGTFEMIPAKLTINKDLNDSPRVVIISADPTSLSFDGEDPPVLKSGQDDTITLTVDAQGFQNPEFKITGAGFGHTDISQSAETSFTNNGTTTYSKALSAISTHSDTNLVFTATVRETDDPENSAKQVESTLTVSFLKDGEDGGTGVTGDDGDGVDIVFKRSTTVLTTAPSASSSTPPSGWYTDVANVPALSNSLMYSSVGSKLAGATNWIWQVPIQIEGSDGTDGISIAELTIYQRSNTLLTSGDTPSSSTYNFGTNTISNLGSWSRTIPTGSSTPLYASATVATVTGATGTTGTLTWSTPVLSMQDGTDGDPGLRTIQGYLYQEKTTSGTPNAPGGTTYTFSTGKVSGSNINDSGTTNTWKNSPNTQEADSTNTYYTIRYTGQEATAEALTITVSYSAAVEHTSFSGVVTFVNGTGLFKKDGTNITTIDGGGITTGMIRDSDAFTANEDGTDFTTNGMVIDLDSGNIATEEFKVVGGSATFKGALQAASGSFSGSVTASSGAIGGWAIDTGYIYNGTKHTTAGFATSTGITLNGNNNGSIHSPNFYINSDGTAGFRGTLTISGTNLDATNTFNENTVGSDLGSHYGDSSIAGWTLSGGGLYSGRTSLTNTTPGIFIGQTGISLGDASTPAFKVTAAGELTATSGSFSGTITSGATLQANTVSGASSDLISMGQNTTYTMTVDGSSTTFNMVLLAEDNGGADDAAIVGIGQKIGVAGQGSTAGGYFQSNGGTHWGNIGTSSYGVYCDSLKVNTMVYPNAPGTTSQYLRGDGSWQSVSGGGGSGTITGITAGTHLTGGGTSGNVTVSHLTTAGNKHIPTGGSSGQFLKYSSSGTAVWDAIPGGLALGTGSGDAHRGDHGSAAYTHSQSAHAPSNATANTGTVTNVATGNGLTGGPISTTGTISHANTSNQASSNNAGRVGIQDITLDEFGHITGIETATFTDTNTTYVASDFSHNSLSGVSAAQHIDWTSSGAGTINSSNYTNTTYLGGAGMALSGTTFNIGGGTGINVAADQIAVDMGDFDTDNLSQGSTNKYYSDTLVNTRLAGSISTGAIACSSTITADGNITAFNSSDIALKEDLNPISNALDKVMSISGYNFSWKDSNIKERGGEDGYFVRKKDVGMVAQEIEKILPEAVADRVDGTKGVRYELLVPLLVNAIKELKEKVEELENGKSSK
jgi:predicted phage tail protein